MKIVWLSLLAVLAGVFYFFGYSMGIGNQREHFGKTGLPKNCRALIHENLKGFELKKFTAEEALYSIDRNCGPQGLIWNER